MTFAAEWRRRWGSLLTLTLLTALAVGVVLTAFAGARRTESVPDRFLAEAQAGDGVVQLFGADSSFAADLEQLPSVDVAAPVAFMGAALPTLDVYVPLLAPVDGRFGTSYERGILVEGRRPDRGRVRRGGAHERRGRDSRPRRR